MPAGTSLLRQPDATLPHRLARSASTERDALHPTGELLAWIAERGAAQLHDVRRIPFDRLHKWRFDDATGDLGHDSGKFFRVQGLRVQTDHGPVRSWTQPIINQPEVAILGTGTIQKQPRVIKDADGNEVIAIRSVCYLALSYDHRLVDGADAARYLMTVKKRLEEGDFAGELSL